MLSKVMKSKTDEKSIIRAMFEEGCKMSRIYGTENVYDFSLGNPNVPAPEALKKSIVSILDSEDPLKIHGYMQNAGFNETRQAFADIENRRTGRKAPYRLDNIIVTTGAAAAINIVLKTILDENDEVVVFAPYFLEYINYIDNYRGRTIVIPPDENKGFIPDHEKLQERITNRTKAVIINNPNNPTGVIYPKDELIKIADVLKAKQNEYGTDICLISDEPYRELNCCYMDDGSMQKTPVVHLPDIYDNTVVCYSFSKSFSVPGERIGYILVPDSVAESQRFIEAATVANRIMGFVNAPSLIQLAVARCSHETVDAGYYAENGKLLYDALSDMGYECVRPQGAFYLWVKVPKTLLKAENIMSEEEGERIFAERLKHERILVTPGKAFEGEGYVRISYCVKRETIEGALPGFCKVIKEI